MRIGEFTAGKISSHCMVLVEENREFLKDVDLLNNGRKAIEVLAKLFYNPHNMSVDTIRVIFFSKREGFARGSILNNFNEIAERATQAKSGTTFLTQGAPSAGKSALLNKCDKWPRIRDRICCFHSLNAELAGK